MNSGGPGDCRSRGSREAIPKPVSQAWPVAVSTRIFEGFRSLWITDRLCNWPSALKGPSAWGKTALFPSGLESDDGETHHRDPRAQALFVHCTRKEQGLELPMLCRNRGTANIRAQSS